MQTKNIVQENASIVSVKQGGPVVLIRVQGGLECIGCAFMEGLSRRPIDVEDVTDHVMDHVVAGHRVSESIRSAAVAGDFRQVPESVTVAVRGRRGAWGVA